MDIPKQKRTRSHFTWRSQRYARLWLRIDQNATGAAPFSAYCPSTYSSQNKRGQKVNAFTARTGSVDMDVSSITASKNQKTPPNGKIDYSLVTQRPSLVLQRMLSKHPKNAAESDVGRFTHRQCRWDETSPNQSVRHTQQQVALAPASRRSPEIPWDSHDFVALPLHERAPS